MSTQKLLAGWEKRLAPIFIDFIIRVVSSCFCLTVYSGGCQRSEAAWLWRRLGELQQGNRRASSSTLSLHCHTTSCKINKRLHYFGFWQGCRLIFWFGQAVPQKHTHKPIGFEKVHLSRSVQIIFAGTSSELPALAKLLSLEDREANSSNYADCNPPRILLQAPSPSELEAGQKKKWRIQKQDLPMLPLTLFIQEIVWWKPSVCYVRSKMFGTRREGLLHTLRSQAALSQDPSAAQQIQYRYFAALPSGLFGMARSRS